VATFFQLDVSSIIASVKSSYSSAIMTDSTDAGSLFLPSFVLCPFSLSALSPIFSFVYFFISFCSISSISLVFFSHFFFCTLFKFSSLQFQIIFNISLSCQLSFFRTFYSLNCYCFSCTFSNWFLLTSSSFRMLLTLSLSPSFFEISFLYYFLLLINLINLPRFPIRSQIYARGREG
jgi:hypothetical protein